MPCRLVTAEVHFRSTVFGGPDSWNHRVAYMKNTIDRLFKYYGENSKGITHPVLSEIRGHRAKSVIYPPQNDMGNYDPTFLVWRYDAFIFFETTQPLTPIA